MVPLPKDPGIVENYEHLLRLESNGVDEYLPVGAKESYQVPELLDGLEDPEQRRIAMEVTMGDKYEIRGQAAAVGRHARAESTTLQQIYQEAAADLDLSQLAKDLAQLRGALQKKASNADQYRALAAVSEAEEAAEKGDGPTALKRLKAAGQWALDTATKIGVSVAAKAIQSAIGL